MAENPETPYRVDRIGTVVGKLRDLLERSYWEWGQNWNLPGPPLFDGCIPILLTGEIRCSVRNWPEAWFIGESFRR
jgi:hypothetical protein